MKHIQKIKKLFNQEGIKITNIKEEIQKIPFKMIYRISFEIFENQIEEENIFLSAYDKNDYEKWNKLNSYDDEIEKKVKEIASRYKGE